MLIDLLRRVKGWKNQYKLYLKKWTANSMTMKTVGFCVIIAVTSIQIPVPNKAEANPTSVTVSDLRLDTTKPIPVVIPEKQVVIKVERKPDATLVYSQRAVVARDRATTVTASVPKSDVQAYAMKRSAEMFGDGHWSALQALWMRESGWNSTSTNSSSGACGIPQANPCSKAGGDYRTNAYTQVEWGLKYIAGRYGNPSNAWAFWTTHRWY